MLHHSTKKKAEAKGIVLEDAPEGSDFPYRAFVPELGLELWGTDAPALCISTIAARMHLKENPGLKIEQGEDGSVTFSFGSREIGTVADVDDLPDTLSEVLDELTDEEREEATQASEAEEAEEDERGGSVVPEKYKQRYKEQGTPNTCGDWLAVEMSERTTLPKGGVDADAVVEIARLNGLDMAKVSALATKTSNGWQGRLRMTVRNMLVKKVAVAGFLAIPAGDEGDQIKAPEAWCRANMPKAKEAGGKKQVAV
jgi:hypothetical protein